jgi:V/A-type H+-transporting ATPase subunit E
LTKSRLRSRRAAALQPRKRSQTPAAQETDARCRSIAERAASGAALRERRAVLAEKQRLLGETLERARQAALALPDDDYFALLLRMAKRYALGKSGEAAFSARDQKRMPKDFPAKLDAAAKELGGSLTVSKEPRDIDGGFVLLYGGMEENCSLTALFDANREDFLDAARAALFGEG